MEMLGEDMDETVKIEKKTESAVSNNFKLEEVSAKLAELKREVECIAAIKAELEELEKCPTRAEFQRIREMTELVVEHQMKALCNFHTIAVEIRFLRVDLMMESEEINEMLAQLKDKGQQANDEMIKILENMKSVMV